jgi:AcrR family transcriptional regulator
MAAELPARAIASNRGPCHTCDITPQGFDVNTNLDIRQIPSTRQAILDAVAELLIERNGADFSVREVAERSGLTHRTVYRYFPRREDLLGAGAAQQELEEASVPISTVAEWIDGVASHFAQVEAAFDTHHRLLVALLAARFPHADQPVSRRDERYWELFRREHPHLGDGEALATLAILRHTLSATSYLICRLKFDLAPAAVVESLQDAARSIAARAAELDRLAAGGEGGSP